MGKKSASKAAANEATLARSQEEARQAEIKLGTSNINTMFDGNFDGAYYDGIAKSYMDFANPQLAKQHADANKSLVYDLARGGKLDSSTRATKGADLQEAYDIGQQEIADKALGATNNAKKAVEDARSGLISQVNATGDATGATNAAVNRMGALSQPEGNYSTLANMFADFTGTLGSRYAAERAHLASGGASSGGYSPVFGAKNNSVSVRG